MAPHSSPLAWKIPWTEEPGGLQSMGSLRVGHDSLTSLSLFTFMHWRRKWQPTPVFLPGESQGRRSLVGCCLQGRTESDTTEATQQQQQQCHCKDLKPYVNAAARNVQRSKILRFQRNLQRSSSLIQRVYKITYIQSTEDSNMQLTTKEISKCTFKSRFKAKFTYNLHSLREAENKSINDVNFKAQSFLFLNLQQWRLEEVS